MNLYQYIRFSQCPFASEKQLEAWILVGIVFYLALLYDVKKSRGLCMCMYMQTCMQAYLYVYMCVCVCVCAVKSSGLT